MSEMTKENEKKFDQLFQKFLSAANVFFVLNIIIGLPLIITEQFGSADWSDRAHQAMTVLILVSAAIFFGGIGYMFFKTGKLRHQSSRK